MLIPFRTDAHVYHAPIVTTATIIVNVLLFIPVLIWERPYASHVTSQGRTLVGMTMERFDGNAVEAAYAVRRSNRLADGGRLTSRIPPFYEIARKPQSSGRGITWRLLTLEFGKFRPWQWLTANYMHANLLHLLGNMFVLWGFGQLVEGKVGWWKFLAMYNVIGAAGNGLIQFLMLPANTGIALGASLAIFGILAVSLVWAPTDEMHCLLLLGYRAIPFTTSIMNVAMFALFIQVGISILQVLVLPELSMGPRLRLTSELLHLLGAAIGFGIGTVMVKRNMVDCGKGDIFSVWAGENVRTTQNDGTDIYEELEQIKRHDRRKRERGGDSPPTRLATHTPDVAHSTGPGEVGSQEPLLDQFRELVAAGKPLEAWGVYSRARQSNPGWQPPEPDFFEYIRVLQTQELDEEAARAMYIYLQRYFDREAAIRLALSQLLSQKLGRPGESLKVLTGLNEAFLSESEKADYSKIQAYCRKQPR